MNIAVVFAGGVGKRMKSKNGVPKQFMKIDDVPIIVWTLKNFQDNPEIDCIVISMLKQYIDYTQQLILDYKLDKVKAIVPGGETGQDSIYNGLVAAKGLASVDERPIVLIHDGVRPFLEDDLISRNIDSVKKYGSAISCVPSKETIVKIQDGGEVSSIIDRSTVWMARAPQSFYLDDILSLHKEAIKADQHNIIDSCTMMMSHGKQLHMVETCAENIKITTPEDYFVACGLMKRETSE